MTGNKKSRLGRGLDHLISAGMSIQTDGDKLMMDPDATQNNIDVVTRNVLHELPIERIVPNPKQARRIFDEDAIRELAESIAIEGLLQPIIVRPIENDYYSIVAGERRFRAMKMIHRETVTAKIIDANECECAVISLIENLQRESLNPVEEAEGFFHLSETFGLTQEQIAQKIGKARATIANAIRLLNLEEEILRCLEAGQITVGHAKVLLGIEDQTMRLLLLEKIISNNLNVRQTERQAHILKSGNAVTIPSTPGELSASLMKIERQIAQQLAANVFLQHGSKHGKIIIEYSGEQELLRIIQSMGIE